jgi:hypothetical protein
VSDGTVCDEFNLHCGYWEAKGTDDDLVVESAIKPADEFSGSQ